MIRRLRSIGTNTTSTAIFSGICFAVALCLLALMAFYVAKFIQIKAQLNKQLAIVNLGADSLERLTVYLGDSGFLMYFNEYVDGAGVKSVTSMRSQLDSAYNEAKAFEGIIKHPRDAILAGEISETLATYESVLGTVSANAPKPDLVSIASKKLNLALAGLQGQITAYRRDSVDASIARMVQISDRIRDAGIMAVAALLALAILGIWFIRWRFVVPLAEIEKGVHMLAGGYQHVGDILRYTSRSDEVGALARAINHLHVSTERAVTDIAPKNWEASPFSVLEARYYPLFDKAVSVVNRTTRELQENVAALNSIMSATQKELTDTVLQVGGTCSDVAQTSKETQNVVRSAAHAIVETMEHIKAIGNDADANLNEVASALRNQVAEINATEQDFRKSAVQIEDDAVRMSGAASKVANTEEIVYTALRNVDLASKQMIELIRQLRMAHARPSQQTEAPVRSTEQPERPWPSP